MWRLTDLQRNSTTLLRALPLHRMASRWGYPVPDFECAGFKLDQRGCRQTLPGNKSVQRLGMGSKLEDNTCFLCSIQARLLLSDFVDSFRPQYSLKHAVAASIISFGTVAQAATTGTVARSGPLADRPWRLGRQSRPELAHQHFDHDQCHGSAARISGEHR